MRLPAIAHTSRDWRIHELTRDFRLEDVWALPVVGGPDDFPRFVQTMATLDPGQSASHFVRALFAIRFTLGRRFGWDSPERGIRSRVPTLLDRLPSDLLSGPRGPDFKTAPFRPLYMTNREFAAELANQTMHGVIHLGWVPAEGDRFRAQMAILVKPNGLCGRAYMAGIKPFRYVWVYPTMLRDIEREWQRTAASTA